VPTASATTTNITIGGIGRRQAREVLCLTVSVDHDIVDGAPAARFTQRLKELIEEGHGLADALVRPRHASVAPNRRPSP
jgi:pyruvate/2-oxoglutarate dehydrogenase complex dihydrolipoamide acyltransferase (E2) component